MTTRAPRAAAPTAGQQPPAADAPPAEARPWFKMGEDGPFDHENERTKPHPEVELLIGGMPVIARWGMYSTASGGRAFAWLLPNGKTMRFDQPDGWRPLRDARS